jgi:hypothetical protein
VSSTGNSSFGGWDYTFRADFTSPTSSVSIDAIADDSFDLGRLQAFDAAGNLLATYDTAPLTFFGAVETMTISRPTADIAYIIAGGINGEITYLDNLHFSGSEPTAVTDANGNYEFTNLAAGDYLIGEVPQPGWVQTFPTTPALGGLLSQLNAHNAAISALVPSRFDFSEGDFGNNINDGGNDMYDGGNFLNTNLASAIPYTTGAIVPGDSAFGVGSQYFTAKYPGLFVLAADDVSINSFSLTGNNGADGSGSVNGAVLTTTVHGQPYTIFLKRVYNAGDPSINHIVIVPGNGAGVSHTFSSDTNNDLHTINGLGGVHELYYLLVARSSGGLIADADILNIANEFLGNVVSGAGTSHQVTVTPGQNVMNVDFGNHSTAAPVLAGDFNMDGIVDAGDYVLWRKSAGNPPQSLAAAAGTGNGPMGPQDYTLWRSNFGNQASGAGATLSSSLLAQTLEPTAESSPAPLGLAADVNGGPHESSVAASSASANSARMFAAAFGESKFTGFGETTLPTRSGLAASPAAAPAAALAHARDMGLLAWVAQPDRGDLDSSAAAEIHSFSADLPSAPYACALDSAFNAFGDSGEEDVTPTLI